MIESEKFKELAESWKAATDHVLNCQEIISLVIDLNYFVVRGWANELDIQYQILKIEGAI